MAAWCASSMRLDGKVILVCGAGGLGGPIAMGLAEVGASLAVADVKLDVARSVADSLRESGHRAIEIAMDVSRPEECSRAVRDALALGPLWGAVNCAGINIREPAVEVAEDHWDRVIDINLKGAFFFAQAAARVLIEQGKGGRIVTLSSQLGLAGFEDRAVYCASKGGIVTLAKALAIEWAPYGITVNTIAPTFIVTPLNEASLQKPGLIPRLESRIPMGRLGKPEDLIGAMVFLLSESAGFVTGYTLPVDGGWFAS